MDAEFDESAARAHELVTRIRADRFESVTVDGELLALAALMRAAHLLESLAEGPRVPNDPLICLGFRDVLETTVNGLFCLARPDDYGRFVRKDLDSRAQIAKHLDRTEDMESFLTGFDSFADGPGQMNFGQRLDAAATLDGVSLDAGDVGRTKAMYAALSNFAMHGGAGVLGDYLAHGPGGVGVHPLTQPEGLVDPRSALDMATGMVGIFRRAVAARLSPDA